MSTELEISLAISDELIAEEKVELGLTEVVLLLAENKDPSQSEEVSKDFAIETIAALCAIGSFILAAVNMYLKHNKKDEIKYPENKEIDDAIKDLIIKKIQRIAEEDGV